MFPDEERGGWGGFIFKCLLCFYFSSTFSVSNKIQKFVTSDTRHSPLRKQGCREYLSPTVFRRKEVGIQEAQNVLSKKPFTIHYTFFSLHLLFLNCFCCPTFHQSKNALSSYLFTVAFPLLL